jgi:hypothetical protein
MDWSNKLKTPHGREKYWSRVPGKFVNVETGEELSLLPYAGTVLDWYKSLAEVIFNTSNELQDPEVIITGENPYTILQTLDCFIPDVNGKTNYGKFLLAKKRALPVYFSNKVDKNKLCLVRNDGIFITVHVLDTENQTQTIKTETK